MVSHAPLSLIGPCATLASILVLMQASTSLARSTEAGEFFIAFSKNTFTSERLRVFISTQEPSPVHFALTSDTFYNYYGIVTDVSVAEISIPEYFEITSINDRNKGLWLRTTDIGKKVSVYVTKDADLGSGGYLALPCERYTGISSYTYFVSSYLWGNRTYGDQKSNALVIGCENNTQITISPTYIISIPADLRNALDPRTSIGPGESYTITLHKQQTAQLETVLDLTGTRIVTNKPIALLSGHECADVPMNVPFCDYIVDQLPPTLTWGRFFLIGALNTRTAGERFKITALKSATLVKIHCSSVGSFISTIAVLQSEGSIHEFEIQADKFCSVQSDKPIQLVHFSTGFSLDNTGDPFMLYVPPVEQYTNNYTIKAISGFQNHMTIVAPLPFYDPNSILVNGASIPDYNWSPIFCSNSVICGYGTKLALIQGVSYHIRHTNPLASVSVFAYGFEYHSAYGYAAGMLMEHIADVCTGGSLRLAPETSVNGQPVPAGSLVEVCVHGSWSSVCGRGWDGQDASVVCRQLGFSPIGALASMISWTGSTKHTWPYIFSSVDCTGSETRLSDCTHDNSIAECSISEGAAVQCQPFPSTQVSVAITTPLFARSTATLRCTIYIDSALTNQITVTAATWEKDNQPLDDDITITSLYQEDGDPNTFYSDLMIASLSISDEGTYSCTATTSMVTGTTVSTVTASTSITVPEMPSALFQLTLIGVGDCSTWLLQFSTPTEKAMEVIDDIVTNIQASCQCSLTTNHITDAVFQCFQQNSHQVTFHARVHPTPEADSMNIINNITAWIESGASVTVHGVLLTVALQTQVDTEMTDVTTEAHQTTPTLGGSTHTEIAASALNIEAIVGGSVAVMTVFIIAVAVTILSIACLSLRFKRNTPPASATNAVAIATDSTHTATSPALLSYEQTGAEKPPLEDHTYVGVATDTPHPPAYTPV